MAKSLFEQLGGTYHKENGYFIPDLRLPAEEEQPIGTWGWASASGTQAANRPSRQARKRHLDHLKQYHKITYTNLLTGGKLNAYLTDSQINVLLTLADIPEKKLSFKELEKSLALAQSTTAGLISRLELKDLVSVTGDGNDKRIIYVQITPAGESCCKDAETAMFDMEKKLLASLSESERKEFFFLLKKVKHSFPNM